LTREYFDNLDINVSSKNREELAQELIRAARQSEAATAAFDDAAFQKLGVNRTDGRCLDIIENEGPLTAGRLAGLSGLTTAAITAVLDRLERAGYARRLSDPADRRRVLVEIAPGLSERGAQIWGPLGREAEERFADFTPEQLETVIAFFRLSRELNERHVERVRGLEFD